MKVVIQYCAPCGYEPRAVHARARFRELANADVELARGSGGVFEITVDGQLKFSKKQLGRFPTDDEVDALARG